MGKVKRKKKSTVGFNILNLVKKEVDALQTRKKEISYSDASYGDYYGCEWHDAGGGDD